MPPTDPFWLQVTGLRHEKTSQSRERPLGSQLLRVKGTSDPALQTVTCLLLRDE